jgi:hypothetical protein
MTTPAQFITIRTIKPRNKERQSSNTINTSGYSVRLETEGMVTKRMYDVEAENVERYG